LFELMVPDGVLNENMSAEISETERVYEREIELERFLLRTPGSLVMMLVRLETPVPIDALEKVVEKLNRMHPLLHSRLVIREDGTAYFTTKDAAATRLKVLPKTSEDRFFSVIDEENRIPFHMDKGPLARIVLLDHETHPDILLYFHHVICDGLSLVYLTRHLMECMADPEREVVSIEPILYGDELLKAYPPGFVTKTMVKRTNSNWSKRRVIFGEDDYQELVAKSKPFRFKLIGFDEEETLALRDRCRAEGVTINSALLTAMLVAKRETPGIMKRSDEIGFAVNIRKRLPVEPGEACALYASGVTFKLKYGESRSFWENAQTVHRVSQEKMADDKALFERRAMTLILDPSILDALIFSVLGDFKDPMIDKFAKKFSKADVGTLLTNLGGTRIPKKHGPYIIDDVLFITGASAGGAPAVLASGIMGKLNIALPYYEHLLSTETINLFGDAITRTLRDHMTE
jgi:NRPS condensation-like uncharacterized protein